MAHTNWLRYTWVRGTVWHPCWAQVNHRAEHRDLAPHRRHLRCTLPPAGLRRFWFQYVPSPDPIFRDIWLHDCGLASTAQDLVLNYQCELLLTNGHAALTRQGLHEVPRAG